MTLKTAYVDVVRMARDASRRIGLLDALERSDRSALRYLRTLFAVYDAQDLASLGLPWWNYRTIRMVERFLAGRPDARVFEYGSGASTAWLASRAASVHTVEHDAPFVEVVRELVGAADNVELLTVPAPRREPGAVAVTSERSGSEDLDFTDYVGTIERVGGRFDLIVVDGRARVESFRRAIPYLADGGMVLFDDVERRRYAPALHEPGFESLVLSGLTPCLPFPTSTALLRRAVS